MSNPPGLGQPGPGQPDFSGPNPDGPGGQPSYGGSQHYPVQGPGQGPPGVGQPGVGQPSYGQPGPYPVPDQPGPPAFGQQYPQPGYPAPAPGSQYRPPPPGRQRRGRPLIVAGAAVAVVVLGLIAYLTVSPQPISSPTPSAAATTQTSPSGSAQPTVVRTSRPARPTTSASVTGGAIGEQIDFSSRNGKGTVTVRGATWTDNGVIAPNEGEAYLVVDVTFAATSGKITAGPFFTRVSDSSDEHYLMAIGADLQSPMQVVTLDAGETATGQLAFELPRGPVTFEVLDELLRPVAEVEIPA